MIPTYGTRLLCASFAFVASACTNTGGSSSAGSGAGSGDDGGGGSDTPSACAYMATTVTGCDGIDTSSVDVQCLDEPCSQVPFATPPVSVGDCYGYTEYSEQTDLHETCDQWQASGGFAAPSGNSGAASDADAGTCASLLETSDTGCSVCIRTWCPTAWCGCADDANLDDAGLPRCVDYVDCLGTCVGDAGAASLPSCESRCASGYTPAERAHGSGVASCLLSHCNTSSACG